MEQIKKVSLPTEGTIYKKSEPFIGKVTEVKSLVEPGSADVVQNIVVSLVGSQISYAEGQSLGVIPPGQRDNGKPHPPRLYSIASARKGEDGHPDSVTFCVKLSTHIDDKTGEPGVGLCSDFLCKAVPGDELPLTGPTGNAFLLPTDDSLRLILVATGTGIAPYRAFFAEIKNSGSGWKGGVDLFFGSKTSKEALYMNKADNSLRQMLPPGANVFTAFSREQKSPSGEKIYVQHRMMEQYDSIRESLEDGSACFYFCGLKGMEKGVEVLLEKYAAEKGMEMKDLKKELRTSGRWNVEVY